MKPSSNPIPIELYELCDGWTFNYDTGLINVDGDVDFTDYGDYFSTDDDFSCELK